MTLCDSTKVTASMAPTLGNKRRRGAAQPPIISSSAVLRGTTEDHLSELMMAHSALGQPDEIQIVGPTSADEAMILSLKNST